MDDMEIMYASDEANPCVMQLSELMNNFDANDGGGWHRYQSRENVIDELTSRGWCEGQHENGMYCILNLKKLGLKPA